MAEAPRDPGDGPLVVVTYRLPDTAGPGPGAGEGGLIGALEPVVSRRRSTWIGWDGEALASSIDVAAATRDRPATGVAEPGGGRSLVAVPLAEADLELHGHGFCNRTLWPLLHGLLDTSFFLGDYYAGYFEVNRRFAESVLAHAVPGARVWVHDYHLLLVPRMLRERGFRGRIDFFLHTPFPAPEVFRALPWRLPLLEGLLASDTVVFHVEPYRDNFVGLTTELLGAVPAPADERGAVAVHHDRGATVVAAAPIGVDVDAFEAISRKPEVAREAERIRGAYGGRTLLFAADRLDYTKGVLERFRAVERLLTLRPETVGRFHLIQIVVPGRRQVREYRDLRDRLDREVGRINGMHARSGWIPLQYRFRTPGREELVAEYLAARVAVVTPLRDGMNLVAAEFVASRTDERGALVLSEFAGIARLLGQALIVNPFDADACAQSIHRAMTMGEAEQRARMTAMRERIRGNPVAGWADRCLGLPRVAGRGASRALSEADALLRSPR